MKHTGKISETFTLIAARYCLTTYLGFAFKVDKRRLAMEPAMYELFLLDTLPLQQTNIASYALDGRKVWLKKAAKRNSRLTYLPLTLLARWLRVDALKPVPNLGGEQSIAQEAARIKVLSSAGVAVPTILAEAPEGSCWPILVMKTNHRKRYWINYLPRRKWRRSTITLCWVRRR